MAGGGLATHRGSCPVKDMAGGWGWCSPFIQSFPSDARDRCRLRSRSSGAADMQHHFAQPSAEPCLGERGERERRDRFLGNAFNIIQPGEGVQGEEKKRYFPTRFTARGAKSQCSRRRGERENSVGPPHADVRDAHYLPRQHGRRSAPAAVATVLWTVCYSRPGRRAGYGMFPARP